MKISILCHSCLPFHGRSLEIGPLGGTETGVILLTKELVNLGHTVKVYSQIQKQIDNYYPINDAIAGSSDCDVVISVRDYKALAYFPNKVKLFWTGDSYDQPFNVGMGDKRAAKWIDLFLAVSEWHRQTLCEVSGFPLEKSWVIRNGINTSLFENSNGNRHLRTLIYSSMPYRGFVLTPGIYEKILRFVPDAKFNAFTGFGVVNNLKNEQQVNELDYTVDALRKYSGFTYYGNVKQNILAEQFCKSGILFYPNTFEETSCITAIESMAGGCVPIVPRIGALPETISDCGIFIDGNPGTEEFANTYARACAELMLNVDRFTELSNKCRARGLTYSWKSVAENLVMELKNRFNVN